MQYWNKYYQVWPSKLLQILKVHETDRFYYIKSKICLVDPDSIKTFEVICPK